LGLAHLAAGLSPAATRDAAGLRNILVEGC